MINWLQDGDDFILRTPLGIYEILQLDGKVYISDYDSDLFLVESVEHAKSLIISDLSSTYTDLKNYLGV